MKKIILALLVLVGCLYGASIQIPSITLSNVQSQPFVDVNVYFSSEKDFAGYQITIQYNQQILKLIDVQKGQNVFHFTVMTNTNAPGSIKIAGFNPMLSGVSGNGILAVLRFQIINPGYSNLIVSSAKISDSNGQTIPCSSSSGYIKTGENQQPPEKPTPKPQPEETKPKGKPVSVPASPVAPEPKPSEASPQIPIIKEEIDIDEFLTAMERTLESKETEKDSRQQKPSNGVTLLVLSEYGNPVPSTGITTFSKGDRVECRVETEILLNDMEKVICMGCEGTGSAHNTRNNMLSFTIEKDSKIAWKWKKIPVEPGIIIEAQPSINFACDRDQISIPLKIRFLGGFNKSVYVQAKSQNFDAVFAETCIVPEKKETTILLKKKDKIGCGKYQLTILAEPEGSKTQARKDIEIAIYASAMLGEITVDESTKVISIPLVIKGDINNLSSFEIILKSFSGLKFVKIVPLKEVRIFSGHFHTGNLLKINGGIVPAIETGGGKIFNIILSYSRKPDSDVAKLMRCSFWDDKGRPVPVFPVFIE
ncbi:MAG: cohesin domain-containing protein [Candidatus Omnitrophica bacterium]|nr:cohesin domain-containing protein [Candidatus Omnitrophota bacterium]